MKIFMNNKVYVNQKDFIFLLKSSICEVPDNIIKEAFPVGIYAIESNKDYDFIVFESDDAKKFFRKLNFVVNYNSYKDKSADEIYILVQKLMFKQIELMINKRNNHIELIKLNHMISSLNDIIRFKRGYIEITLPEKEKYDKDLKYKVFLKKMMEPIKYD